MSLLFFDEARGCALLDSAGWAKRNLPPGCSDPTADQFAIDQPFAREPGTPRRSSASRKRPRPKWDDPEIITQLSDALQILRKSPEGQSFFLRPREDEREREAAERRKEEESKEEKEEEKAESKKEEEETKEKEKEEESKEEKEEESKEEKQEEEKEKEEESKEKEKEEENKEKGKEEEERNSAAFWVAKRFQNDFRLPETCYELAVFNRGGAEPPPGFHRCVRNDRDRWVSAEVLGKNFFLPPRSSFLMCDARTARPLLLSAYGSAGFDLVVMDPPWTNKSVKRQKRYHCLENDALLDLPLRSLLAPGGLLAVWCTNSGKHQRYLEDCLLPAWELRPVAKWLWLKVTRSALPVLPFDFAQRRAFEVLFLAAPASFSADVPPRMVFASVPSCLHSRKPPLLDLLEQFLEPPGERRPPRCLELFARDLHHGWSSWGNEPLRFQHESCFLLDPREPLQKIDLKEITD